MTQHGRVLNWRRDPEHHKLPLHTPHLLAAGAPLPAKTDLRPVSPAVYDQGQLGSCTANATTGVFEIKEKQEGHDYGPASRLAVYYWSRALGHTVNQDSGSTISVAMKAILQHGLPPETCWPYVTRKFKLNPPQQAYQLGLQRRPVSAMVARVLQDHDHIVAMLAAGNPIAFGFDVFASFMTDAVAQSGIMPVPAPGEQQEGGHAVAIVGHDDQAQVYIVRNSWGLGWGQAGYFEFPYAVMHSQQASDFVACVDAPK